MDEIKKTRIKEIDKEVMDATQQLIALEKKVLKLMHEYINLNKPEDNIDKPVMNIHTRGGGEK